MCIVALKHAVQINEFLFRKASSPNSSHHLNFTWKRFATRLLASLSSPLQYSQCRRPHTANKPTTGRAPKTMSSHRPSSSLFLLLGLTIVAFVLLGKWEDAPPQLRQDAAIAAKVLPPVPAPDPPARSPPPPAPPTPSPPAAPAPPHPAASPCYLILGAAEYGRYSNQRTSLLEGLGAAGFLGRTLLAPQPTVCGEPLASLFDLRSPTVEADVLPKDQHSPVYPHGYAKLSDLAEKCGPTGVAVQYHSMANTMDQPYETIRSFGAHGSVVKYRGVAWTVYDSTPLPAASVPEALRAALVADVTAFEPYSSLYPWQATKRDVVQFMLDPSFPYRLRALPASPRCILVPRLFNNFNWAVAPGALQGAIRALRPSPEVAARVAAWWGEHGVAPGKAVGVHLRMGDMAKNYKFGFAHDCETDPGFVVRNLTALVERVGAGGQPLLIATDSWDSGCVSAIRAAFPKHVRVEEAAGKSQVCSEVGLVQEVLGNTAGFVGNGLSTFSSAIHGIRVVVHGASPTTSVFPLQTFRERN